MLKKSCGTCEHCHIGSVMCSSCSNFDNWAAEKMNTVVKELKCNMTMEKSSKTWKVTDISVDGSDTDGTHVEVTVEGNLPHGYDFPKLQDRLEKRLNDVDNAISTYKRALNAYYGKLAFDGITRWSKTNPHVTSTPTSTLPGIRNVIFSAPATIIIWMDNTKTVVKCGEGDVYDPEKGFAMAISKKILGNKGNYYETYKHWLKRVPENEEK